MVKAVLFDFDGTLVDTAELIIESFKHTYKTHLGISVEREEILKYFGEPLLTTLERYDKAHANEMLDTYRAYNESIHDIRIREIEGSAYTVKALRKEGIKTAVVSSKRRIMVERGLKVLNMMDLFDEIVSYEDTERGKPHGDPALKGCSNLGIEPCDALMVGDSHYDILCGKDAGCLTCLVSYTALEMESLMQYKPDYVIDKLANLLDIVKDNNDRNI